MEHADRHDVRARGTEVRDGTSIHQAGAVKSHQRTVVVALAAAAAVALGVAFGNAVVPVKGRGLAAVPMATSEVTPSDDESPAPEPTESEAADAQPTAQPTQPATTAASHVTPAPTMLMVGGRPLPGWPSGVAFPPNATLGTSTADHDGGVVTLRTDDAVGTLSHLRGEFVKVGLKLDTDHGTGFTFSGTGWSGIVSSGNGLVTMTWSVGEALAAKDADDLGLRIGVPFHMKYPAGVTASNPKLQTNGSSYDLVGRTPADLLAFYRAELTPLFTITSDETQDGVTTLRFTDGEYDSVITATGTGFHVVHTKR